jgi:hypothetical protein
MGSASQLGVVSCNSSPNGSIVLGRLLAGWHYVDFFKNFLTLSLVKNLFSETKMLLVEKNIWSAWLRFASDSYILQHKCLLNRAYTITGNVQNYFCLK